MSSRRRIEISSPRDRTSFDERLEQPRLDRRVLVAAAEDVDAVHVLSEDQRDVSRRKRRLGWFDIGAPFGSLAHVPIVPRPTGKRSKRNLDRVPELVYVRGSRQAPQPERIMSASNNKSPTAARATSSATSSSPTRRAASTAAASRRASRPSRTATCTSATPRRSASTSAWRASSAAPATCASTTPTRPPKTSSTSRRSRRTSAGSASSGRSSIYASDYFEKLYQLAEKLIEKGLAYVDSLTEERDPRVPRRLLQEGQAEPVPRPPRRREPRPVPPHARGRVPRGRARAAREDRSRDRRT